MSPPDSHRIFDPWEALRRDRDRWAQLAMDQAEYIRQLEQQLTTLQTQFKMKNNKPQSAPNIYCDTYIAEINNDIHDNHNCTINACPTNDEWKDLTNKKGNDTRVKRLFITDGVEDRLRTEEEMNRFHNYLADHHLGQRQLDCSADNPIHKAIVCFCIKWRRLKYIDKPSPAAVLRFLTETCGITCAADPSALCTLLGRMFKSEYDKEVFFDVEDYF